MFRWRRRNDGFEWREYVRTTILVRRKQRRDRIGEAGKAAVRNVKEAGQRGAAAGAEKAMAVGRAAANAGQHGAIKGAAGAKAVGRGAASLGQRGAILGIAGLRAAGQHALRYGREGGRLGAAGLSAAWARLCAAMPIAAEYVRRFGAALLSAIAYTGATLRVLGALMGDYLGPPLVPVAAFLRRPNVRPLVFLVGVVALAGGIIRAHANGFVTDTWIALAIGMGTLAALAAAHLAAEIPRWLSAPFAGLAAKAGTLPGNAFTRPAVQMGAAALAALLVLGGVYTAWGPSSDEAQITTASTSKSRRASSRRSTRGEITGRATAVTGDVVRVGSTLIRLEGIEAPEPGQLCLTADRREWLCGRTARQALTGLLRGRVACTISGDTAGFSRGSCRVGELDVAAKLVRDGHVFARTGLLSTYGGLEDEAREAKLGLWAGEALRPADYRAHKWEEAKQAAPEGCPIKGNVRGGRRVYVVPWARNYERVKVVRSRGERWFCSEEEAREAGFQPNEQS